MNGEVFSHGGFEYRRDAEMFTGWECRRAEQDWGVCTEVTAAILDDIHPLPDPQVTVRGVVYERRANGEWVDVAVGSAWFSSSPVSALLDRILELEQGMQS